MAEGTRAGRYVALLRGINVGGKNNVPMKMLASMFVDLGCTDVQTYIQSGNVIYTATEEVAESVTRRIPELLRERLGLKVPVVTRTAAELREAVQSNPFLIEGKDESTLHLAFLRNQPTDEQIAALDPERSPGDRFAVRGREVYLFCPNGVARTKLTNAYFDSQLKTMSTMRNWRTVLALIQMVEEGMASGTSAPMF